MRPFVRRDAAQVARWLNAARREGAFRRGDIATARSVLAWHAASRDAGRCYACWILETPAHDPIGYFDWALDAGEGELLGIYIEPRFRRAGLGRHMIRWAACAMRDLGMRRMSASVYADNVASLRAFRSAGLRVVAGGRTREDGRAVDHLRRPLAPLARMLPRRTRYEELRGENLYLHHAAVADLAAEALGSIPGVDAVLGMGSIARGFGDEASDIDLAVIGRGAALDVLRPGEHPAIGTTLDLFVVNLDRDPFSGWDPARRQAFEESVVLRTGGRSVVRALRRSLALGPDEREARIVELLFRVGWLGFHPPSWDHRRRGGYVWSVPYDGWVARGDLASAHGTIDQAVDLALQLTFLLGWEHPPDPKWRRFLVPGANWRPRGIDSILRVLDTAPRNTRGFISRADALRGWMDTIGRRLISEGMVDDRTYPSFLARCADYRTEPPP